MMIMKMWKIENKVDGLVYYYTNYKNYWLALNNKSDFHKRAMANYIIMPSTNSLIKCRESLEEFFNRMCE